MRRATLLLVGVLGAVRPAIGAVVTEVHYVMGTYFRTTAEGVDEQHTRAALQRCFTTARDFDARFSRFETHSELALLNANADLEMATLSPEMAAILQAALHLEALTDGAFDVGAGALTHLWRTASDWPNAETIAHARSAAGSGAFSVAGTTLRRRAGVVIDLDGIAKGWTIDRCVAHLRDAGITRAFLSFGESSLYALGAPAGTHGWDVTLRDLDGERALGTLTLRNAAVSVSAVFGHERQVGVRRVGHIVDPRNGLPLTSPALAVVVAPTATDAEAFSKALLVNGTVRIDGRARRRMTGGLLVRPARTTRLGHIAFRAFSSARPIVAAAEPLR